MICSRSYFYVDDTSKCIYVGVFCTGEIKALYCNFPLRIILPSHWLSRRILRTGDTGGYWGQGREEEGKVTERGKGGKPASLLSGGLGRQQYHCNVFNILQISYDYTFFVGN